MRKVNAYRWRLSFTLLAVVLVALGSFWLVELMNQSGQQMQQALHRNEPDYIVERFSFVRMDRKGQPSYIIAGDKLTHRPVDDSSEIERPRVRSLTDGQPPLAMHAQRARVDQNNSRVLLSGEVEVLRAAAPGSQALALRTEALTVFPDDETMSSDQPVQLTLGNTTAHGTGLHANNATRQLRLDGRGQLTMPPRGAPRPGAPH